MATYAVGDPHGCFRTFRRLLEQIEFGSGDRLVVVGDLVNRGPRSLEMLEWMRDNEGRAETLLGNHDIYMLLVHAGAAKPHETDTTRAILEHPDADSICDWLCRRPFAAREDGYLVVHAGIPPGWDIAAAERLAREAEEAFRGPGRDGLFRELLGNEPALWDESLSGHDRLRYIVNALTRMRMCADDGALDFTHKTKPGPGDPKLKPWYEFREDFGGTTVVCGHWASLGARDLGHVVSLDSGCAWGGNLTCLRLDDRRLFSAPYSEGDPPPPW